MKRSAGILVYRYKENKLQVLLCHMGGPYWENIDIGGWSIPKGEVSKEKVIDTAIREFQEETSFSTEKNTLEFLGSKKQSNNKLVIIFSTQGDYDATSSKSNTFEKEWPKGSGKIQNFPEMNQAKWMSIDEAKQKILKGQRYFIEKLVTKLESR